jgi:hypothetical protein
MLSNSEETLCAELGRFVIEFEGLIQSTKDTIKEYFQNEELYDSIPIEMLMFDSTSASLAKYFQAISLHYLSVKHSDKQKTDIDKVKKYVNSISSKLIQAGEFRNDVVHATWYLSSMYGANAQLEAKRIKVTGEGAVMRKLLVEPGILDNTIAMFNHLSYFIRCIGEIISAGALPITFHLTEEDIASFNNINFDLERKHLFVDDANHYKNVMKENEEMKQYFKELEEKEKNK